MLLCYVLAIADGYCNKKRINNFVATTILVDADPKVARISRVCTVLSRRNYNTLNLVLNYRVTEEVVVVVVVYVAGTI